MQLVRLGANCDEQIQLPQPFGDENSEINLFRRYGLDGKSARDLGRMSGNQELIQLMDDFKSEANAIKLVHCRCGSRLPWRECHAAADPEPHYIKISRTSSSRLQWRLSPYANCTCGLTDKSYYRCCWKDAKAMYIDDEIGKLNAPTQLLHSNDQNQGMIESIRYIHSLSEEAMLRHQKEMKDFDFRDALLEMSEEARDEAMDYVDPDKISKVRAMDIKIYAGIMKQMDKEQFFQWNDLHWQMPKPELLKRTGEWNTALEQYYNSKGLAGMERKEVIKIHKASEFAPCANPECHEVEEKVKGFIKCKRCRKVGYCSRPCQT